MVGVSGTAFFMWGMHGGFVLRFCDGTDGMFIFWEIVLAPLSCDFMKKDKSEWPWCFFWCRGLNGVLSVNLAVKVDEVGVMPGAMILGEWWCPTGRERVIVYSSQADGLWSIMMVLLLLFLCFAGGPHGKRREGSETLQEGLRSLPSPSKPPKGRGRGSPGGLWRRGT